MNKNENEITSTIAASNMKSLSVRRSATARVNPHKLSSKAVVSRIFYATIMIFTLSFIFINFKAAIENKFADNHESMLEKGMEKAGNSVVTVVLPSVVNPRGRLERLKAIAETWGPASKAVFVMHDDEEGLESWNNFQLSEFASITYPAIMRIPKEISVDQGVERLVYVMNNIAKEGTAGPDFVFFANDHTFVIPEHLCLFLKDYSSKLDFYAGHPLANEGLEYGFNSGASGYALSNMTIKKLVNAISQKKKFCTTDEKNAWLSGNPGILTAACLGSTLHTPPFDTRTPQGEHLFHAFGIVRTVTGNVDEWYLNKHKKLYFRKEGDEDKDHLPSGELCCGKSTVTFHYVEYTETRQLYKARQFIADSEEMGHPLSDRVISNWLDKNWPKADKVGGYSHVLPSKDSEERRQLIRVLRKISVGKAQLPQQCRLLSSA